MGVKPEALAGRRDGEAGVVGRQVDVAEEEVGRLDVEDSGEPEFLGQAVLQGCEGALGTSSREGRPQARPSLDGLCGE